MAGIGSHLLEPLWVRLNRPGALAIKNVGAVATRPVHDPEMAEQLERRGIRVVLQPFHLDDLLRALSEILATQVLIAQTTGAQERCPPDSDRLSHHQRPKVLAPG